MPTDVYLETGAKRVFACAVDWPGWARSAKTEEAALEALADYLPRYRAVLDAAGVTKPPATFTVVERVPGNATTDFGALGVVPRLDGEALRRPAYERLAALVEATWRVFDEVVAGAPAELRKGPRGGGRDRDKIVAHVCEAEAAYARSLGLKVAAPEGRGEILAAIRAGNGAKWPARYAARRIGWHVTDHAWEIEDRSR